jgi:hypothetical protein
LPDLTPGPANGTQVATPAGVNPYVNYANSAAVSQTTVPGTILNVGIGNVSAGSGSSVITVPGGASQQPEASSPLDFDDWFERLSETVELSLQNLVKTLDVTKH